MQHLVVNVRRAINQPFGHEKFGFYIRPQKLLCRHAVVVNKPERGAGGGSQNAHPTERLHAEAVSQSKVQANCHQNGQY